MNKTEKYPRSLIPAAKRALLASGVSLVALTIGMAMPAMAQQSTDSEEIVVTGIRKGIADSLATKRENDGIIEAISAEDIGKLPDESIADSIATLPGLATQRNNSGRDQFISVRGLPADFQVTTLNGRPQTSTSNNRDVQYDQYPAELVSQVLVYKTGEADIVNGGIATIDIKTIRPLDYGKQAFIVNARGQYDLNGQLTEQSSPLGERISATYVDQYAHNTLGLMLGVSQDNSPQQIVSQQGYGYANNSSNFPGGLQDWIVGDNLKRVGYTATLQWKPNDRFEATLDEFYSQYNDQTVYRGLENSGLPTPVSVNGNSETFLFSPQIENYDYHEKDALDSFGANFKYKITDQWRTSLDLNFNDAIRRLPEIELYSGLPINGAPAGQLVTLTKNSAGFYNASGQSYANPSLYALGENLGWANFYPQSAAWGNANGQYQAAGSADFKDITTRDTIQEIKWNTTHDLDTKILSNIEVGFDYSERKKSFNYLEATAYLNSLNPSQQVPSNILLSPTNFSSFGFGNVLTINPIAAWTSGLYTANPREDNNNVTNYFVHERVETFYAKSDIVTSLFGSDIRGNIGAQVIHTNQSVLEYAENGSWSTFTFDPTSTSTNYWDVLPSLNLVDELDSTQDIRFGVGRSMARPRFDQLGGAYTVSYTGSNNVPGLSPWSATSGNPKLKPYISDDVDLSWTKYLGQGGYLSVAGYFKNLETFIYDNVNIISFAGLPVEGTGPAVTNYGPSSSYQNGHGGSILGAEISGNIPLEKVWAPLHGFGLQGNIAANLSSLKIPTNTSVDGQSYSPNGQIPELSKYTGSGTLYYDYEGFEARINDTYRSSYIHEVPAFNSELSDVVGAAENIVNIQASYSWTEGTYKGLTTMFSAQNVTNAPQKTYFNNNPNQPQYDKYFGSSIMWGVSYKM
jgi:iron complex outermembrane receptor protein